MNTAAPPRWADRIEAAAHIGISIATFHRYVKAGLIPKHTIGAIVRYDLNELDTILLTPAQPTSGGSE